MVCCSGTIEKPGARRTSELPSTDELVFADTMSSNREQLEGVQEIPFFDLDEPFADFEENLE